jgi:prolyl-tRNA synthetase
MVADDKPVLILLRGDHQLSETKLQSELGATDLRPAHPEEIRTWFGADAGSLGPVGVKNLRVLADESLKRRRNMIAGANKNDYHLRHVTPGKDFEPDYKDLRQVVSGDLCRKCGGPLELIKCVEIGHIFKLGYKYSDSMGLRVLNEDGAEVRVIMGSYGIGMERILSAAVELYHDKDGMALPVTIAPFTIVVTPVNYADAQQRKAAEEIYEACLERGIDVLLDDRDERPGVKFKDADLIGIPYRVTVGKKLPQGLVEVVARRTRESTDVAVDEVVNVVLERLTPAQCAME